MPFRKSYGPEAIVVLAVVLTVWIFATKSCRGQGDDGFDKSGYDWSKKLRLVDFEEAIIKLNVKERDDEQFKQPGHVWTDGLWRVDFEKAFIKPHDFYFFVALNLRYRDKNGQLMWLAPVWREKHGGWQPGLGPKPYRGEFRLTRRRICPPPETGKRCHEVLTWVEIKPKEKRDD